MPNKSWITRALAAGSLKAVGYQATITYILPLGLTFVTALAGYLEGLPWTHILVGAGLMFGAITTGLVRFDDWIERRRVKGKLVLAGVNAARDLRGNGLVLGVTLTNEAAVEVEFEVRDVRTRLGDRVPRETVIPVRRVTLSPRGHGWFNDHPIEVTAPHPGTLEGFLEMTFGYGRPGELKYELVVKKQVVAAFNEDGVYAGGNWNNAA